MAARERSRSRDRSRSCPKPKLVCGCLCHPHGTIDSTSYTAEDLRGFQEARCECRLCPGAGGRRCKVGMRYVGFIIGASYCNRCNESQYGYKNLICKWMDEQDEKDKNDASGSAGQSEDAGTAAAG